MTEREEFESWVSESGWNLERNDEGRYCTFTTDAAWGGWQAAVKQASSKKSRRLPVAYMFDWYAEADDGGDGPIRDWLTTDYDEAHSPTMGCYNIRPLFTNPKHNEDDVRLILDAFDNIELRRDLAHEIRRILGVSA